MLMVAEEGKPEPHSTQVPDPIPDQMRSATFTLLFMWCLTDADLLLEGFEGMIRVVGLGQTLMPTCMLGGMCSRLIFLRDTAIVSLAYFTVVIAAIWDNF